MPQFWGPARRVGKRAILTLLESFGPPAEAIRVPPTESWRCGGLCCRRGDWGPQAGHFWPPAAAWVEQYCSALDLGTVLGLHHPQPLGLGDSVPQSWLTGRQAQPLNHVRPEGWSIGPSSSASFCFWVCHLQLWEGPMLLKGRASRGRSPVLCAHLWALWPPSLYCPWPSWGYSPAWRVHTWTAPSLAARIPPWLGASFGLAIWHPGTPSLLLQSG